jgi:hypothetical protein
MGGWRRLHNEEIHSMSASPNIRSINVMKRWNMRRVEMGEKTQKKVW